MTFSGLRGRATPPGGPHLAGVKAPRRAARLCRGLAVVSVVVGFILTAATWPNSIDTAANTAAPLLLLFAALAGAAGWWMLAVVFEWLAARYEQAERDEQGQ